MTWLTQGKEWVCGNFPFRKVFHTSLKPTLIILSFRKDEVFFLCTFCFFLRKAFQF